MAREILIEKPNQRVQLFWDAESGDDATSIRLVADGASVDVRGFLTLKDSAKRELSIRVIHEAPNTESKVILRALLDGASFAAISEMAIMEPGVFGSKTHVEAKALLLSEDASANIQPELEISENDVLATHAASVGPLEDEELFYLMSRGIGRKEAERLLIQAFLAPVRDIVRRQV